MAKRKESASTAEIEPPKTRQVDAVHTVKYKTPMLVPVEDQAEIEIEEEPTEDFEIEYEEDEAPRVRRAPTFRSKLKEKFQKKGIGGDEQLNLRIDVHPKYSIDGLSGLNADKDFLTNMKVTESFFDDDQYLDHLKKNYGPGAYWLTVRHKNSVVQSWLETIGGIGVAASPVTRTEGETPISNHPAFYPPPQAPAPPPKTLREQLSEAVELLTLVRKIDGRSEANAPQIQNPPQVSDDVQLASILMKDPEVKAKAIKGLLGSAGQETDLLALAIENLDKILTAGGKALEGVIQTAVIGVQQIKAQNGGHNGQAAAGRTQIQNGSTHQVQVPQDQLEQGNAGWPERSAFHSAQNANAQSDGAALSPEDQALDFILGQCQQKVPVKIAADRLFNIADDIRDRAPANSIDGYVEMFAASPLESILEFLKTVPGAETVLEMPHARDWIASLQEEVAKVINEGGDNE